MLLSTQCHTACASSPAIYFINRKYILSKIYLSRSPDPRCVVRFRVDGTKEGASRVAPVGDYEAVWDACQRAAEEAKSAREQEAVAARERWRRMRMAIGQAAVEETPTSALVSVRDRTEWDRSLVLRIVSHNLVVN
eukprot:SAG31_NODE_111_length_24443_cov_231.743685_4_plen_136_part_00